MAVTPKVGTNTTVPVGGTAVQVVPPNPAGGFITNPPEAVESMFVDAVGAATTTPQGTTFELQPGQTWSIIPGQTTQTTVNAATNGHPFSAIYW